MTNPRTQKNGSRKGFWKTDDSCLVSLGTGVGWNPCSIPCGGGCGHTTFLASLLSLLPGGGASGKGGFVKRTRPVKPNTFFFLLGTSYLLFLVASFPKAGPWGESSDSETHTYWRRVWSQLTLRTQHNDNYSKCFHTLTHFIFTTTLRGEYYYCPRVFCL